VEVVAGGNLTLLPARAVDAATLPDVVDLGVASGAIGGLTGRPRERESISFMVEILSGQRATNRHPSRSKQRAVKTLMLHCPLP